MNHQISSLNSLRESYEHFWRDDHLAASTLEEKTYYEWVLDLLHVKPGMRLLDVACGGGHCIDSARNRQVHALGIDIAYAALLHASENYQLHDLAQAAAETMPFVDGTFDYVTCLGSLEHFFDPGHAIAEIRRVLKPDGRVCIVLPNLWSFLDVIRGWHHGTGITHSQELERFYGLEDAKAVLTENGLTILRVLGYNKPTSGPSRLKLGGLGLLNFLYHSSYQFWRHFIPLSASYIFIFICSVEHPVHQ